MKSKRIIYAWGCLAFLAILFLLSHYLYHSTDLYGFTYIAQAEPRATLTSFSEWAENKSYQTTCAEEDNVNVPVFARNVRRFRVTATHPTYGLKPGDDECPVDFSGCDQEVKPLLSQEMTCQKLFDDGINVVDVCSDPDWWRPYTMNVQVNTVIAKGNLLRIYKKIEGENSWPQFLVFYEDGYMRLIPHPPEILTEVCFGSSVIIGPAAYAERPYIDVQEVMVDPVRQCFDIKYRNGGTARLFYSVNRSRAIAEVCINYDTSSNPFTTLRSMWVYEGNADVDHIQNKQGDFPILGDWTSLEGPWLLFHRKVRSKHAPSGPDIRIEIVPTFSPHIQILLLE